MQLRITETKKDQNYPIFYFLNSDLAKGGSSVQLSLGYECGVNMKHNFSKKQIK